jgi:non-canonical (house-cleaning) NTP pyrophosphatase
MSVVLATKSIIKLSAVEHAFKRPPPKITIIAVEAKTETAQPIGTEGAQRCIEQRLDQAAAVAGEDTKLLVALENYVYYESESETFRDACMLGVRKPGAGQTTRFSARMPEWTVRVPAVLNTLLRAACAEGTVLAVTCGELLDTHPEFSQRDDFSPKDWFLAAGAPFDRNKQIAALLDANRALLCLSE